VIPFVTRTRWGRPTEQFSAIRFATMDPANTWDGNHLKAALVRLGLTDVTTREFMENGVVSIQQL
jgi:hypothetical protein